MAINPSDTEWAICVAGPDGRFPTSPAFKRAETLVGSTLTGVADPIVSETRRKGRTNAGQRLVNPRVEGTLNTEFTYGDAAIDMLLESAFSGKFNPQGRMLAGTTETVFCAERRWIDGESSLFTRMFGCMVSELAINAEAGGIVTADFTVLGQGTEAVTDADGNELASARATLEGATYAAAATNTKFAGPDVKNITIAGLGEVDYSTFNFTLTQDRAAQTKLGSAYARGVGTAGKSSEIAATFYRADLAPEKLIKNGIENPAVAISWEYNFGDFGYRVTTLAQPSFPEDSEDGANQMVSITFVPIGHMVDGQDTDFVIEKLTGPAPGTP
jgi:hypothetical protein